MERETSSRLEEYSLGLRLGYVFLHAAKFWEKLYTFIAGNKNIKFP